MTEHSFVDDFVFEVAGDNHAIISMPEIELADTNGTKVTIKDFAMHFTVSELKSFRARIVDTLDYMGHR